MQKIFYVYVLFRPDGTPCYVGKGKGGRWLDHMCKGRKSNRHLASIASSAGGSLPAVKIREGMTEPEAHEMEIAFIKAIGRNRCGGPLVNFTDGGEGVSGLKHSAETRAKLSAALIGRKNGPPNEETRKKIRDAQIGKSRGKNPEHSARMTGRKLSAETKQKMSRSRTGRVFSEETKEKIRVSNIG